MDDTRREHAAPVRVAFVSDSMPERNGVGAYYADLIAQLDPARIEARFLCPGGDTRGGLHFPLPGDATQHVYLPSPREFARHLRRCPPDVVVVATPGPWGMLGARWARKLGARLIFGFHTDYAGVTDLYSGSLLRVLSRGYFRIVDRALFRRADHVLANSEAMAGQARRMGARDVRRIGTLLPKPVLETPEAAPRGAIERVLFAGRLAPEKRLEQVLAAARRLPDIRFVIAGEGPQKEDVEAAAARQPNLEYVGWLDRAGLVGCIDECDALVLPSEFESFGNVALEAMGRGRIAVVTDTCGIVNWPELAEHMAVFGLDTPLHQVLAELAERPAEALIRRSRDGRDAARALNRNSLAQWLELLGAPAVAR
jgi:glycosyltransferase involved in cell wall biosynthesis